MDADEVNRIEKDIKLKRDKKIEDLGAMLKHKDTGPAFRRFLWSLLEYTHVFRDVDCGENTHETSKLLGRRQIGLNIIADITEHYPAAYLQMDRENRNRKEMKKHDR